MSTTTRRKSSRKAKSASGRPADLAKKVLAAITKALGDFPTAKRLSVELLKNKISVKPQRAPRARRAAYLPAPPGYFRSIYAADDTVKQNKLAQASVLDPADFRE